MRYRYSMELDLSRNEIFQFFHRLEKWLRFNPQWIIRSYRGNEEPVREGSTFQLSVQYGRTGPCVDYEGVVEEYEENRRLTVNLEGSVPRRITVEVLEGGGEHILKFREEGDRSPTEEEEKILNLWLKSVVDYIGISNHATIGSRIWKAILDNVLLKMTHSGRQAAFFVASAETFSLLFVLMVLSGILVARVI